MKVGSELPDGTLHNFRPRRGEPGPGGAGRAAAGGPQDAGSSEQQEAGGRARLVGPRQGGAVW